MQDVLSSCPLRREGAGAGVMENVGDGDAVIELDSGGMESRGGGKVEVGGTEWNWIRKR